MARRKKKLEPVVVFPPPAVAYARAARGKLYRGRMRVYIARERVDLDTGEAGPVEAVRPLRSGRSRKLTVSAYLDARKRLPPGTTPEGLAEHLGVNIRTLQRVARAARQGKSPDKI